MLSGTPASRRRERLLRIGRRTAVALLTLYALVLRGEAVAGRYGPLDGSATARFVQEWVAPLGAMLRPGAVRWNKDPTPYVDGDPINYLKYAREMAGFYQPHVREPMFLAITRGFLWLLNDEDVAVSFASAVSSALVVPAVYLLGEAALGPLAGLGAAAAWAIELDAIAWGSAGWRDDTFTLFFTLTAWALVRLRFMPTSRRAAIAGLCAAGAALTRLTSFSFILPGLAWLVISPLFPLARRQTARAAGVTALIAATLVAPYVINCWRATGDPFYAVNYHTRYYRAAEGLPPAVGESAVHFVVRRFADKPIAALDTAVNGILMWPFGSKWRGFRAWSPLLPPILSWLAIAGLVCFLYQPTGRLLVVLLVSSLLPYAWTWNLGGGNAWRFSEHAYSIYLVAAAGAVELAVRLTVHLVRSRGRWRPALTRGQAYGAAFVSFLAASVVVATLLLPAFVVREALAAGEAVTLEADRRAGVMLIGNWSPPHHERNVVVRAALAPNVGVRLPFPRATAFQLTLRLDPPAAAAERLAVDVFFNRHHLGRARLTKSPDRMGTYRFQVPAGFTVAGINRLELVASETVPAREAGPPFRWVAPDERVAFQLWYVRVEPVT